MVGDSLQWGEVVQRAQWAHSEALQRLQRAQVAEADATAQLWAVQAAQAVAQAVAADCQRAAHAYIAEVVGGCLRAVFGPHTYAPRLVWEERRGGVECRLEVVGADGVGLDPLSECGGGVVDVVAFGLRVAAIMAHRPALPRVLVMDEPFRFLSVDYHPAAQAMLVGMADQLGFQFIFSTHAPGLVCGRVVELG
jgi:hypothetical protein